MKEPERKAPRAPYRDQPRGNTALLIIDMINCFDFEGGENLRAASRDIARPILQLRNEADNAKIPVIYVNDNFGEWHSERSRLVNRAQKHLVDPALAPRHDDYFIIKPQLSGFYSTNLSVLLPKLGVTRLVLTGVATESYVLVTAADAHMRDYKLWVPTDAVSSGEQFHRIASLEIMKTSLGADTVATAERSLRAWAAAGSD